MSKELEIHVNAAKDVLKQYYEKFKNKERLVATFLLIGQLKDRSIRVEVVKDSKLDSAKEKFVKIDCEHFYSLQKCLNDLELLAASGEDLRYSAIKCNEDYIRNEEEIESLRYIGNPKKDIEPTVSNKINNKAPSKPVPSKTESPKKKNPVIQNGKREKTQSQDDEKEKKPETKPEEADKPEKKVSPTTKTNNNSKNNNKVSKKPIQSKQSGFSNLFGKAVVSANKSQAPKKTENDSEDSQPNSLESPEKEEKQKSKDKEEKSKKIQDKGKNIVSTDKDKNKKIQEKEKNKDSQNKEKNINSQEKENKNQQCKEKSVKSNTKNDDKFSSKQNGRGKKRNRSQDNTSTKRKRILVMDSSEDESNHSNDEKEDEPMEVEEEPPKVIRKRSPSPPTEKRENGKRMVRKTVDKTYKDEDGFLVTKKVHIYEVASDNDEAEVKKEEPEKPKPVEKQKKKQTSLMNFFKKS